jgi:UPF0716 protein FxsA
MLPLLFLLFIVVPLVEIYVLIQVGQAIGALWTILLLVADSIVGTVLVRSQGRAVWRRFQAALAERRPPAREVLDGALVIVGGALLLTPGFVTDIFGFVFLLPPTRAVVRSLLARRFAARMIGGAAASVAGRRRRRPRGPGEPPPSSSTRPYDVEGTAVDLDRDRQRLP